MARQMSQIGRLVIADAFAMSLATTSNKGQKNT
jgi:hypothetical protein